MTVNARVRAVIEPVVAAEGLILFDLDQEGSLLIVTVDREGGVDLGAIASTTRAISRALDEHDPIADTYTLEVSSPGLERALRTPAHFEWAIGRSVSIKTVAAHDGPRRVSGTITAADDDGVTLTLDEPAGEVCRLPYDDVEKARTTFAWGPAPKPGSPGSRARSTTTGTNQKRVKAS